MEWESHVEFDFQFYCVASVNNYYTGALFVSLTKLPSRDERSLLLATLM
jgi:hypothetical protein